MRGASAESMLIGQGRPGRRILQRERESENDGRQT